MHMVAPLHQKHTNTHTFSEAPGLAPRVGGDIICFHAILAQECLGTICLSVQPTLSLSSLSLCVCECVCETDKKRERGERERGEREGSVRQLYLHLYEQIPVGRAAEEHTSCLTYIPYQAVFVCTVPWHKCTHTHTHVTTHADRHTDGAFTPFVRQQNCWDTFSMPIDHQCAKCCCAQMLKFWRSKKTSIG